MQRLTVTGFCEGPRGRRQYGVGIKDSPHYCHGGCFLTLEYTVEFFNLTLGTQLTASERKDLDACLRCL